MNKDNIESRGSSTMPAYAVEARSLYDPVINGNQIFDKEWRRVNFSKSAIGVPNTGNDEIEKHGLYSYEAAQALRWWFIANAGIKGMSLETKLIKLQIQTSFEVERLSESDHIGSGDKPSWKPAEVEA